MFVRQLADSLARYKRLHYSWRILASALVLASLSACIFSVNSLHELNDTKQLPVVFPGNEQQWQISGNEHAFKACGNALCVNSPVGKYARLIYDIPVEANQWPGVDQLLYEVVLADKSGERAAKSDMPPSFIVARARSATGKNLRNLGRVIILDDHPQEHVHRRISSFDIRTASLQIVIVVQGAISSKIAEVRFYSVRLSARYQLIRAIIFSGWLILLLLLALRVLSNLSTKTQLSTAIGFSLLLVVGASQYGSTLTSKLTAWLATDWNSHLPGILLLANNTSLAWIHVAFHFIFTASLGIYMQQVRLTYVQIISINASIAIGVECVQMAIPERSADLGDLASALLGTFAGLLLLWVLRACSTINQAPASRRNP